MGQSNYVTLISLLIFVAIVALFFRRWMVDALIEAINNFRGSPPGFARSIAACAAWSIGK